MTFAHCGGPDEKIPPAPGANPIVGFVVFQLTSSEKDKLRNVVIIIIIIIIINLKILKIKIKQ